MGGLGGCTGEFSGKFSGEFSGGNLLGSSEVGNYWGIFTLELSGKFTVKSDMNSNAHLRLEVEFDISQAIAWAIPWEI